MERESETGQPAWFYIFDEHNHPLENPGKWLLYYRNEDIEEAWEMAKSLRNELQEAGIPSMKCSNKKYTNPRASSNESQVIVFFCGPATEDAKMKNIGRKLIKIMNYKGMTKKIYYKSDWQTAAGTRATGSKDNHLYSLPVESLWGKAGSSEDDGERPASEVERKLFTEMRPDWAYKRGLPSVRLHFSPDHVNEEWRRAKYLLLSGGLIEQCVSVDCDTMGTERAQKSLLLRMKFYLNIDVSQCQPEKMRDFIKEIYIKMKFVSDEQIGLYEFGKQKPLVTFNP